MNIEHSQVIRRTSNGRAVLTSHEFDEDCQCADCSDDRGSDRGALAEELRNDWDYGRE